MPSRIWLLLSLVLLVPAGLVWFAHERALLAKVQERAERIATDFDARKQTRPAFGGARGRAGSAWTHYLEAAALPEDRPGDQQDRFARAAALLRAGAECTDAHYPGARLQDGYDMEVPDVLALLELGRGVLGHADALQEDGRVRAGLRVRLDVALFGRDLAAGGSLVCWCAGNVLVNEALEDIAGASLGGLARAEVWSLAVELEQLEAVLPSLSRPLQCEMAAAAFGAGRLSQDMGLSEFELTLFKLIAGSTLAEHQECLAELMATESMPWSAAVDRAQQVMDQVRSSLNPMLRLITVGNMPALMQYGRRTLARIRAMRVVLNWSALGKRLHLVDPFGDGPLSFEAAADGAIRCRSQGTGDGDALEVVLR